MQYTDKDYQFLGKQVAAGRYVSRNTCALALVLALLLGLCLGRYVFPNAADSGEVKAPMGQGPGAAQNLSRDKELLQSIFRHEEEVRKDPANEEAWVHLGDLYFDAGEAQKAVDAYNRALEINPRNTSALVDCGVMYRQLKDFEQAMACFGKALEIDPGHEHALFNSGIVLYFDLNRKDEALAMWKALLKVNPDAKSPSGDTVENMIETLSR
ncbi:tetratricopeptide repeat protein [Desulfovibrio sp. OttesenSCG-928-G11]|nr:tetratricopeptide repeat protein [Desulfovibrio sp. OttesenSCG-928-G11]